MTDTQTNSKPKPALHVAPGPHVADGRLTTRRMMIDVLIALLPAMGVACWVFRWFALIQVCICVASCVAAEAIFTAMRRKRPCVGDFSAVVTGVILAFSLPAICPWWVSVIGAFAAIGLGKVVFGGVGMNLFNPAMVGRAFVMIAFAGFIAAGGYQLKLTDREKAELTTPAVRAERLTEKAHGAHAVTEATPMTSTFSRIRAGKGELADKSVTLWRLFLGNTNGSLGETSAIALLLGGLYLLIRRTAAWQIPAGAIVGLLLIAGPVNLADLAAPWGVAHHLLGGAFMLGAFFIITDPVTSPLTARGRFIYGVIFGVLVMLIRLLTSYPEGVMFSVLLVNAITPLLNRWTIPRPVGGPATVKG